MKEESWDNGYANNNDLSMSSAVKGGNLPDPTCVSPWTLTPHLSTCQSTMASPWIHLWISFTGMDTQQSHRGA